MLHVAVTRPRLHSRVVPHPVRKGNDRYSLGNSFHCRRQTCVDGSRSGGFFDPWRGTSLEEMAGVAVTLVSATPTVPRRGWTSGFGPRGLGGRQSGAAARRGAGPKKGRGYAEAGRSIPVRHVHDACGAGDRGARGAREDRHAARRGGAACGCPRDGTSRRSRHGARRVRVNRCRGSRSAGCLRVGGTGVLRRMSAYTPVASQTIRGDLCPRGFVRAPTRISCF